MAYDDSIPAEGNFVRAQSGGTPGDLDRMRDNFAELTPVAWARIGAVSGTTLSGFDFGNFRAAVSGSDVATFVIGRSDTLEPVLNISQAGDARFFRKVSGVTPTNAAHLATKGYVDTAAAGIALDGLTDVTITSPTSGQVLVYSGGAWVNGQGSTVATLDDLTDVTAPTPTSGNALAWNGSAWVPSGLVSIVSGAFDGALLVLSGATQPATSSGYTAVIPSGAGYSGTYDTGGYYSASQPTRLTVQVAGYYIVEGNVGFALSGGGIFRGSRIVKNGNSLDVLAHAQGFANILSQLDARTAPIFCTSGDYFEFEVYQDHSGVLDILGPTNTWVAIHRVLAGQGIARLDDVPDVNVTGATSGQILVLSGSTWVASGAPSAGTSFSGAKVVMSSGQLCLNINSGVKLDKWDVEEYDDGGWWSAGTPERFTVPAGVNHVRFGFATQHNNFATGVKITRNGALQNSPTGVVFAHNFATASVTSGVGVTTPPIKATAGDYFEIYWDTGNSTNVTLPGESTVSGFPTTWSIEKVR